MAVARDLVTLGRAARNKVNIKIRQPLSEMVVILSDPANKEAVAALDHIIKEELNIKAIRVADDVGEFVAHRIKPRFDLLGPKYGRLMKDVVSGIETLDPEKVVPVLEKERSVGALR